MSIHKKHNKQNDLISQSVIRKQILTDLEKRVSLNLGNYLVLTEEGDPTQIALAHQKAKGELLKCGPEMNKLAQQIGGILPEVVHEFLDSVDSLLHTNDNWLDDEKISRCFHMTQKLESELKPK